VHRHVRRVGDQIALRIEQRAGEVQPLLDVDRRRRVRERDAHLLRDRHEQIVEHFEQHRIDPRADRARPLQRLDSSQQQVIQSGDLCAPAWVDHCRGVPLADDCRSHNRVLRPQRVPIVERRVVPLLAKEHGPNDWRSRSACRSGRSSAYLRSTFVPTLLRPMRRPHRLRRNRFDHQPPLRHQEPVPQPILLQKRARQLRRLGCDRQLQRAVRTFVLERQSALDRDVRIRHTLREQSFLCVVHECRERCIEVCKRAIVENCFDGALLHHRHVRETNAVGRQHTRERMHEHRLHPKRIRDQARMLTRRAAEARQRVFRYVVTALH
jgi:hypothetical protein